MYGTTDNDTITVGELGVRFLVEAADSNGSASVFECYVPASSRMPAPHSHDGFEETIYGLEGTTIWTIDNGAIDIAATWKIQAPVAISMPIANIGEANSERPVRRGWRMSTGGAAQAPRCL